MKVAVMVRDSGRAKTYAAWTDSTIAGRRALADPMANVVTVEPETDDKRAATIAIDHVMRQIERGAEGMMVEYGES